MMKKDVNAVEKVRGSVINGFFKYVKKKWGKDGVAELEKDVGFNHSQIKDGEFYDRELLSSVLRWISEKKGMDAVKEGGRYTVKDLGLFKYLLMWSSLERIIARAMTIYKELYKYGSVRAQYEEDQIIIEMRDTPNRIKEDCAAWLGAYIGLTELTHTKADVVEEKCVFKGDDACVYKIYLK